MPSGWSITDLYCASDDPWSDHYVYTGQPDGAIFTRTGTVGSTGIPSTQYTQALTAGHDPNLETDTDRVARRPLMDRLYRAPGADGTQPNAGFAPAELPASIGFDVLTWESGAVHAYLHQLRNRTTGKTLQYPGKNG